MAGARAGLYRRWCVVAYTPGARRLTREVPLVPTMARMKKTHPSDLNNAVPTPPPQSRARLKQAARRSRKLDSPQRTNESTIDPDKPPQDILKGYHGG